MSELLPPSAEPTDADDAAPGGQPRETEAQELARLRQQALLFAAASLAMDELAAPKVMPRLLIFPI